MNSFAIMSQKVLEYFYQIIIIRVSHTDVHGYSPSSVFLAILKNRRNTRRFLLVLFRFLWYGRAAVSETHLNNLNCVTTSLFKPLSILEYKVVKNFFHKSQDYQRMILISTKILLFENNFYLWKWCFPY